MSLIEDVDGSDELLQLEKEKDIGRLYILRPRRPGSDHGESSKPLLH